MSGKGGFSLCFVRCKIECMEGTNIANYLGIDCIRLNFAFCILHLTGVWNFSLFGFFSFFFSLQNK